MLKLLQISLKGDGYGLGAETVTQEIVSATPPNLVLRLNEEDKVVWLPSKTGVYTSKSAWEAVRLVKPVVPWAKLVWFSRYVPRWSFILWLVCNGRMSNKDRVGSMGGYC